ncbi:MAG: diguanylate cyclase [Pseudomonadota bacterium]
MSISFTHTKSIDSSEIRNPRVLELYGLWNSHRRDGRPPRAASLLPEALALCGGDLLQVELVDGIDLVYRRYGANLIAEEGRDLTGERASAFDGALRRFLRDWYMRALEDQDAIYTVHRAESGTRSLSWERLLLPLEGDNGAVDQVLVLCLPMLMRLELLSGVIESSHCGVMALEAIRNARGRVIDFQIVLANPQADEILGEARGALVDQRLLKRFPESRESGLFHSFVAIAEGSPTLDLVYQRAERWLRISAARTGLGVTLTMTDVTSLKEQNAELEAQKQELEREIALRTEAEYELVRLATLDALTGLPNRRHFFDRAERELLRAGRSGAPLSLLYMDVDHFKQVNDSYGHAGGDAVLQMVAEALGEAVRPYDLVGRLGGEEFAILLPQADAETSRMVAERVRGAVAAGRLTHTDGREIRVTISGGAATARAGETLEQLVARADAALYEAKRAGRDQVKDAA